MPPKKRGRPPKAKGEDPPAAKRLKQPTSLPVLNPFSGPAPSSSHQAQAKAPTDQPSPGSSKSSVSQKDERKSKVNNSHVHKEFVQESKEDTNGNKTWTSKCKHCPPGSGKGEYKDRQASHLKSHLKKNHPEIFSLVEDKDKNDRAALESRVKIKDKQGRCLNRFIDLFANTGLPLSMADNPYVKALLNEMDSEIKFPGRKGTTNLLVKERYGSMCKKMLALLKRARVVHATTDCWSNSHCRSSFIGFTGHCYDPLTKTRKSFRIALREFNESHTADGIIRKAIGIFKEYQIKHKVQ